MISKLEQLKQHSVLVADTGDIQAIARLKPIDATTNPSLLVKSASTAAYAPLLQAAAQQSAGDLQGACDRFAVAIGLEILSLIQGRVSTEVDAHLAFDQQATYARAHHLMDLYAAAGIGPERVLIKIAATWEGIAAAQRLEREGIQCNLTLVFSIHQAIACAEAGVFLISPFVGRIYDWYKKDQGRDFTPTEDPGVKSVQAIYAYFKAHQYATVMMAASFRHLGQIEALAGCDRLTISPALLEQLATQYGPLERALYPNSTIKPASIALDEARFRWYLNENAMANDKLAEGIRLFAQDQRTLEKLLQAALKNAPAH